MELQYSFICNATNTCKNGDLNALGIFHRLFAPKFPCIHPKLTFVAHVLFHQSETGKHKIKLLCIDQDGKDIISPIDNEIDIKQVNLRTNIILEIVPLSIPKAGTYEIALAIDGRNVATNSIAVLQINK